MIMMLMLRDSFLDPIQDLKHMTDGMWSWEIGSRPIVTRPAVVCFFFCGFDVCGLVSFGTQGGGQVKQE